jgi:hypothetical protein
MTITICGSMSFAKEILVLRDRLVQVGYTVIVPHDAEEYAAHPELLEEKWDKKREQDLIRRYFDEIQKSDAILVLNMTKNSIANYVGGNAFMEMAFAHVLHKTIYLFHPIPDMHYRDEMMAMQPVVLNGALTLLYEKANVSTT